MDSILDYFNEDHIKNISAILGLILFIIVAGIIYISRNRIIIKYINHLAGKDGFNSRIPELGLVISSISDIINTHLKAREGGEFTSIYKNFAFSKQTIDISKDLQAIAKKSPVDNLVSASLNLIRWIFQPPVISIEYYEKSGNQKSEIGINCYYAEQGFRLMKKFIPHRIAGTDVITGKDKDSISRELACKIILDRSENTGISSWEAFNHLTLALNKWPKETVSTNYSNYNESKKLLTLALKKQSENPLILYNLAIISYYYYKDDAINEAVKIFKSLYNTTSKSSRIYYLSMIGLSRSYCQMYHRYGIQKDKILHEARYYAAASFDQINELKKVIPKYIWKIDLTRAYYCKAFSYHVTEKSEDIKIGIENYVKAIRIFCPKFHLDLNMSIDQYKSKLKHLYSYENRIRKLPYRNKPYIPAVIFNNLAYILMVEGGRFRRKNEDSDKFWSLADELLTITLSREKDYKFAYANKANIKRLMKDYEEAVDLYEQAIKLDKGYVNGYGELGMVYIENREENKAMEVYNTVMKILKNNNDRKSKINELFARGYFNIKDLEKSNHYIKEALKLNKTNKDIRDWIENEPELKDLMYDSAY